MTKGSSNTKCCKFTWSYENFSWLCEMDKRRKINYRLRKMCKLISHDHDKISDTHAKWSRKCFNMLQLLTLEFLTIVRNVNILCEMLNFQISLNLEGFRSPMRGCQVSTWPWPINRNLNFSCNELLEYFWL